MQSVVFKNVVFSVENHLRFLENVFVVPFFFQLGGICQHCPHWLPMPYLTKIVCVGSFL